MAKINRESGKNLQNLLSQNNNNNYNEQNNSLGDFFQNNEIEHKIQSSSNFNFSDKIRYIINQLNDNNIKEKANEIKQLCNNNENLLHQFSDSLIKSRIIGEENNHELYFKLIIQIESKELINFQISDTIK